MKKYIPLLLLIILGISTRLVPHPANFTAIGAVALFSGLYFPKRQALLLPLAAMVLSDIILGFYEPRIMFAVYTSFVLTVLIGTYVANKKNAVRIISAAISGSLLFFLVTNAAVWAFGTMYPHTLSGLFSSYYMALPFWRNELLGTLVYTGVLVGGYELAKKTVQNMLPEQV